MIIVVKCFSNFVKTSWMQGSVAQSIGLFHASASMQQPSKKTKIELKRRLKAEQKAKEKAEKDANKAVLAPTVGDGKQKLSAAYEEISPNEYFKLRTAAIAELKKSPETNPYPHKFHVSISLENYINKYANLKDGDMIDTDQLSIAGRVRAIRESGAKLIFHDLRGEGVKLQVMANV